MKNNYTPNFNIFNFRLPFLITTFMLFFGYSVLGQCPGGTVAHYKMDESTGATSFDDFQNNNDGSCVSGASCPTAVAGLIGGAQQFNGTDQFIEVPSSSQFDFTGGFTILAWVKFSTTSANSRVIVSRTNNDGTTLPEQGMLWWLGIRENTNVAKFVVRDNVPGPVESEVEGTTALNDGNWHQIVGVNLASGNRINIYVDGKLEGSVNVNEGFKGDFAAPGKPLRIGNFKFSDVSPDNAFFDGAIDNVGIFDRGLCDDDDPLGCGTNEILENYDSGIAGIGICPAVPVITSSAPTSASIAGTYTYQVEATGDPFPTFSLTTSPTGMDIDTNTGLITWTPEQADAGTANVTVVVTNSQGSNDQSFTITVTEENDPPTFDNLGDQIVDEDSGPQTVSGWATNIDDGDPELDQTVSFEVVNNSIGLGLFAVEPAISPTGELTFTPADNANGIANITVTLVDDGSPSQSSTPVDFTITINPVNDAPEFTLSETEVTGTADFDEITINVIPGPVPADEVGQTVLYSLNPQSVDFAQVSISPTSGLITINPLAGGGEGDQEFEVIADDGQTENNTFSQTFTLSVSGPIGIGDSELAKSLSVFPIPGSDQVTLRMENEYLGAIKVKIFDMTGKMIKGFDSVKNTHQHLQELDVSDIQSGTYYFYVILDNDIILEKLLMN